MKKLVVMTALLVSLTVSSLLFSQNLNEGFEGETVPPHGWIMRYANANPPAGNLMIHTTVFAHEGEKSFRFSSYSRGEPYDQYLITPRLESSEENRTISFFYRRHTAGTESFRVGWSTEGTDLDNFEWGDSITGATTEWQRFVKDDLPIGDNVYVCIHYNSDYDYYLYVDTVSGPPLYTPEDPPSPAINESPEDEAENVSLTPILTWEAGDAFTDTYDVYFGERIPDEPNSEGQDSTSFDPGVLEYSTTYYWKIVPRNEYGEAEDCPTWSFTTLDDPTISTFPWRESFAGEEFPPAGWSQEIDAGTTLWQRATGGHSNNPAEAQLGDRNARFYHGGHGHSASLYLPPFDLTELEAPMLSFWHAQAEWAGDQDELHIYYRENQDDDWEPLARYTENITEWTERVFNINPDFETVYFRFKAIGGYGYGVVLDNFFFGDAPSVLPPSNLTATNISNDRAALGWRENGDATRWDIEVGLSGFEPTGTPTVSNTAENPHTVTDLTHTTRYDFYVRANAGDGEVSEWVGPASFQTTQTPANVPFTEYFAEEINWQMANGTQTNKWVVGTATAYEGERSAYISNDDGETNFYNVNSASTVHIYRDIRFPEEADRFLELSFRWKGMGEGNYDYMRVYLVDTDVTPEAGSFITTGQLGGNFEMQEEWTNQTFELPDSLYAGEVKRLVFTWRNDASLGTQPPVAIDSISVRELEGYPEPRELTATSITGTSVRLGWTEIGGAEAWDIELGLFGFEPTGNPTRANVEDNPYLYQELNPSTNYQFYVRSNHGDGNVSDWTGPQAFATSQIPAELPFFEDFEEDIDWQIVNGTQTNQWHIGDIVAYEGERAAFISNDGGETNAYNITAASIVHIFRDIAFPEEAERDFEVSFYWKGMGEGGWTDYDYMRVHLVDTDVNPQAGSFVTVGQIGQNYNLEEEWQHEVIELSRDTYLDTTKRLVFTWRNDASVGTQPPVAIDNVMVRVKPVDPNPTIAGNPNPTHNATDVSIELEHLEWRYTVDTDYTDPIGFRVYFTDEEEFGEEYSWVDFDEEEEDYSLEVPAGLIYDTTYRWQVIPTTIDPDGRSTGRGRRNHFSSREGFSFRGDAEDCPVWVFTTEEFEYPEPLHPEVERNIAADYNEYIDFGDTNIGIIFPEGNPAQDIFVTVYGEKPHGTPPDGVDNIAPKFWKIISTEGANPGTYNITIDIEGLPGIANPSELVLLKRDSPSSPWVSMGNPDEIAPDDFLGPLLTWEGLTSFSDFSLGGNNAHGNTLPVELSSFTVNVTAQMFVNLQWVAETETNMLGYNIYRNEDDKLAGATTINPSIISARNSSDPSYYSFEDTDVLPGNTYYYWLQSIDLDLTYSYHGPLSITVDEEDDELPPIAYETQLHKNYPNPFNPSTTIEFSLREETHVSLKIYNILGRRVKTLYDKVEGAGNYTAVWDGYDEEGNAATSGIYFYRLVTDNFSKTYKMIMVK